MLCSGYKQILFTKTYLNNNAQFRCFINARFLSKGWDAAGFWASLSKNRRELIRMNSVRFIFKDISLNRFWFAWTRSVNIAIVVKRCRKDRAVREVIHCFRQTFLRPRRTLLLSATAAFKVKAEDDEVGTPPSCSQNISDEDLEALLLELENVAELSKRTLFCENCSQRLVIDKKHPGVKYCMCKDSQPPKPSEDGWDPYMEADDVVIWRKEYKQGQGQYIYKVYGRYKEVQASDFAAIQVDGNYRRSWDDAVASMEVLEQGANGLEDQAVIHWEVLWPRLFANRDYVYIRRHKQYDVTTASPQIFTGTEPPALVERPSVHSNAKRKSMESYRQTSTVDTKNTIYVIVSRACTHDKAPPSSRAIRVTEYWSHMLVRTIHGTDQPGMEFVLTYYDEPAVGGLPAGVAAWATGRAAPAYLLRMRHAAHHYSDYRRAHPHITPDFAPFHSEKPKTVNKITEIAATVKRKEVVVVPNVNANSEHQNTKDEDSKTTNDEVKDQEIVSNPDPTIECDPEKRDQSTQTEDAYPPPSELKTMIDKTTLIDKAVNTDEDVQNNTEADREVEKSQEDKNQEEKSQEEKNQEEESSGWRRYLFPLYYFI